MEKRVSLRDTGSGRQIIQNYLGQESRDLLGRGFDSVTEVARLLHYWVKVRRSYRVKVRNSCEFHYSNWFRFSKARESFAMTGQAG
jgi:hypothetical protein